MMIKENVNILVFIPDTFETDNSGFIEGFYQSYRDLEAYYITNNKILPQCKNYIGYTGKFLKKEFFRENTIFIENDSENIHIKSLEDKKQIITEIYYDFEAFKNSAVVNADDKSYGVHINKLTQKLSNNANKGNTNGNNKNLLNKTIALTIFVIDFMLKIFTKLNSLLNNCATFSHLENGTKRAKQFLKILEQERTLSPKIGNAVFAKIVDLILGIFFIYFCLKHEDYILGTFKYISQDFVTHLRQLLIYLMGSPIGLKLNYAFNHSLGRFFFYHINLWRVFLQAMQPLLEAYFRILLVPALLGVSYQLAILCDIVSLATFHVYCIYVYAARLFFLQIGGLSSLWRLFIGRKYNPLRSRVDSCEYSSNQLFIGILGFTVLLFLLPTTTLYYLVFATFRLATLITYTCLAKIKDLVNSVPLYIVMLWIFRSSSIAGTLQIHWKPSTNEHTRVEAKLTSLSLTESIHKFSISSLQCSTEHHSLKKMIHHLFTGQLV